jgi:hypothetical protein
VVALHTKAPESHQQLTCISTVYHVVLRDILNEVTQLFRRASTVSHCPVQVHLDTLPWENNLCGTMVTLSDVDSLLSTSSGNHDTPRSLTLPSVIFHILLVHILRSCNSVNGWKLGACGMWSSTPCQVSNEFMRAKEPVMYLETGIWMSWATSTMCSPAYRSVQLNTCVPNKTKVTSGNHLRKQFLGVLQLTSLGNGMLFPRDCAYPHNL